MYLHIIVTFRFWCIKLVKSRHFLTEVPVPSQESERSCIWVFVVSNLPFSTILLDFGTVKYILFFNLSQYLRYIVEVWVIGQINKNRFSVVFIGGIRLPSTYETNTL